MLDVISINGDNNAPEELQTVENLQRELVAVRASEARFRAIFEHAPDCYYLSDMRGVLLEGNCASERLTGYLRSELIGKTFVDAGLLPQDQLEWAGRRLARSAARQISGAEEFTLIRKDGSGVAAELQSYPTEIGGQAVVLGCVRDISARKAAEEALRRSEASLGRAQRMASLCHWELDCRTHKLECSVEMYRIFGLPLLPVASRADFLNLVHARDRERVEHSLSELLRKGQSLDTEFRIERPDGSVRWLHEHAEVEAGADGLPARALGVIQDVTEYRAMEERLQTAQKLESVGRLAGGIAHDFNNLLTIINGYSDVLLQMMDAATPDARAIQEIRKAGEKAATLTHQLLTLSRQQVIRPVVMDVNAAVRDMDSMLRRVMGEEIELTTVLEPAALRVEADPGLFRQAMVNLSVNARDTMGETGRIVIETASIEIEAQQIRAGSGATPGPYVLVAISDNGAGMDEETRSHIFEPFYSTRDTGRGNGLGMSTVYGIVKQSGGWIWVYSEPGKGSTVKLYLPRVAMPVPAHEAAKTAAGNLTGNETVLVVEDQAEVRNLAAEILESFGYRVLTAEHGAAAMAVCERFRGTIDLVVSDVVMPGIPGRELAVKLRAMRPDTKVLFMSGYTDNIAVYRAEVEAGAAFLQKPFSPRGLAAKVREALGPNRAPATILVVDDEIAVRGLIAEILIGEGYRVLEAENGTRAIAVVGTTQVDLMVTDLVMPEKEGIETILELRKSHPSLEIVAMSGAFSGEYLSTARLLGAQATLAKPIDPVGLVNLVREILQKVRK